MKAESDEMSLMGIGAFVGRKMDHYLDRLSEDDIFLPLKADSHSIPSPGA